MSYIYCNFCGDSINTSDIQVVQSVIEPDVKICKPCVDICASLFEVPGKGTKLGIEKDTEVQIKTPKEIFDEINQYVIGQDKAKKALSVAIYNHYKRVNNPDLEIEKSNILMVGPTGTGKTHTVKTIAKLLDIPFAAADATSITESGYVGEDASIVLRRLYEAAGDDVKKAEMGIVYFDEIDKLGRKGENPSITRDVSGEGVQQALLKMIEGDTIEVPLQGSRKHPNGSTISINTKNILFICSGSFEGIEKLVAKRKNNSSTMGLLMDADSLADSKDTNLILDTNQEDLKSFGMLPELIGRLPVIAPLHKLTEEALISILTQPKNAIIKQYTELFKLDNIELKFTKKALTAIANKAIETKTGARGLRSIIEDIISPVAFESPGTPGLVKIIIDDKCVTDNKEPKKEFTKAI